MYQNQPINPFFNAPFYLGMNNDLIRAGLHTPEQLWQHYIQHGAYEVIDNADAWRVPNAWFDVTHYLSLYPDLIQNGISAATALDHYYYYGIHEHREISDYLNLANFNTPTYAEANPDVAAAVGAENEAGLLKHYLEFGYKEEREGAGVEWAKAMGAEVMFGVDGIMTGWEVVGTLANDTFMVTGYVEGATIDGLGGFDTVVFNAGTRTGPVIYDKAVTLKHIEKIVFNDTVAVDMIWAGKAGELQLVNNGVATLRVEGIHTIQLKTTQSSTDTTLQANRVDGSELRVMIENEAEAGTQTVVVGSLQSPALSSIILNGSASQDDLVLGVDSSVAAVKQIAMIGGSGDDTLIASAAMNTFTGGKGADVFDFSAAQSAKIGLENKHISALNTITDFSEKDSLKLANPSPLSLVQFSTGDLPADLTLEAVLSHEKVTDHSYLHWNNHTYLILTAAFNAGVVDEEMEVIKLVGIHD